MKRFRLRPRKHGGLIIGYYSTQSFYEALRPLGSLGASKRTGTFTLRSGLNVAEHTLSLIKPLTRSKVKRCQVPRAVQKEKTLFHSRLKKNCLRQFTL